MTSPTSFGYLFRCPLSFRSFKLFPLPNSGYERSADQHLIIILIIVPPTLASILCVPFLSACFHMYFSLSAFDTRFYCFAPSVPRSSLTPGLAPWVDFASMHLGVSHWTLFPDSYTVENFDYLEGEYPFIRVIYDAGRRSNQNTKVPEYVDVVLSSAPIPVCVPPPCPVFWLHPCPLLEWPYNTTSLPQCPSDLFLSTNTWDTIVS